MKTSRLLFIFAALAAISACKSGPGEEASMFLDPAKFEDIIDGKETGLYKLSNDNGMEVYVTNYGAVIAAILHPGKDGVKEDITLGYDNLQSYTEPGDPSFGTVPGRYANRIDGGRFELDGNTYELPINETGNQNTLHGGTKGFSEYVYDVSEVTDNSIAMSMVSPDGDMGFPGNLTLNVTYILTEEDEIEVVYTATTDAPTVLNVTQHAYFNLHGEGKGTILDHVLMINADHYTPITERVIPTGEIAPVENTPMDFTTPTVIGERIDDDFEQLVFGNGYDHNWVLNKEEGELSLAATVYVEENGRQLEVFTTEPGVQLYCGNFLDGSQTGKSNLPYVRRSGFCLETQHFPDSPNQPDFPSTVLRPGEEYYQKTVFKFSNR
jgi:aldose 1-epimerase